MSDFSLISKQTESLISGVDNLISNLSNISALLMAELSDINWVGFYLVEGDRLVLAPFQGLPACTTIPIGKGVCGTAVLTDSMQLVKNVHEFSGHIACDSASNSEIVFPIHNSIGNVVAVLDIDSPTLSRFTEQDAEGLSLLIPIIEKLFFNYNI